MKEVVYQLVRQFKDGSALLVGDGHLAVLSEPQGVMEPYVEPEAAVFLRELRSTREE